MFGFTSGSEQATQVADTAVAKRPGAARRVLFVDDDPICRLHFVELAKQHGLSVDLAESCDEAIGFARKHQYDLVVCDLTLPRLDGHAVIERLRPTQEHARYVIATGHEPSQARDSWERTPHEAVLRKPLQASDVNEVFDRLLPRDGAMQGEIPAPMQIRGTVLLIESDPRRPSMLSDLLTSVLTKDARLLRCPSLEQALSRLDSDRPAIVLLDLLAPDARGVQAIERLSLAAFAVPVVVISDSRDETLAIQAVQVGAQDYLIKDDMDARSLLRSMHHALDRSRSQRRLARVALYDQLTGAASRMLFEVRAEQVMSAAKQTHSHFALLFVDLDHFKKINDQYGHDVGDALLSAFAQRLSDCLGEGELLARLGGDEFVVLAEHFTRARARALSSTLAGALMPPFELAGQSHVLSASVGMSIFPEDGTSIKQLLRHADLAMYRMKGHRRRGSDRPPAGSGAARIPSELEASMRPALERREFVVHYQPIVELGERRVCGIEAFVRWRHEREGLLHPAAFLQSLSDTGMIVPAGRFVLSESCRQLARLRATTGQDLRLFVNVSAAQLSERNFESFVCDTLVQYGLSPSELELDLTEDVVTCDHQGAQQSLRFLRAHGVRVCLDDFGAGSSSLTQLRRAHIDSIKIDRTVVARLGQSEDGEGVVQATVAMAKALRLLVMAEGVETEQQDQLLRQAGCRMGQGMLYAPPMSVDALWRFVRGEA